jgi:hypothetical protein
VRVSYWPRCEVPTCAGNVCQPRNCGRVVLALSLTGCGPGAAIGISTAFRVTVLEPHRRSMPLYGSAFREGFGMKIALSALVGSLWLCTAVPVAQAAPCLIVTLTGSGGGPPTFNGLAGPGTLVQYGDDGNSCNVMKMQFDAGRGSNMRLSQIGVPVEQLTAICFTHMHNGPHRRVRRHSSVTLALQLDGAES